MLFSGARDGTAYCFAICTAWRPLRSYACSQYPPAHHPPKKQSTGLFFQTEYALLGFKSPHIKTKKHPFGWFFVLVRETGLEPVRCEPHAPQTCASASSATLAFRSSRCRRVILYYTYFRLSIPFFKIIKKIFQPFSHLIFPSHLIFHPVRYIILSTQ